MYGHVNTMLPLAMAAQRGGHEVVVATGADLVAHVERRGLATWPVGPTHAEAGGRDGLSVGYFITSAEKRAVDLVPRAVRWRPDIVVNEEIELAEMVAAACTGARHVVHGLGLMPPIRLWEALVPAVEQLHRQWDAPDGADAVRDATYLHVCPPALQSADERIWRRSRCSRSSSASRTTNGRRSASGNIQLRLLPFLACRAARHATAPERPVLIAGGRMAAAHAAEDLLAPVPGSGEDPFLRPVGTLRSLRPVRDMDICGVRRQPGRHRCPCGCSGRSARAQFSRTSAG